MFAKNIRDAKEILEQHKRHLLLLQVKTPHAARKEFIWAKYKKVCCNSTMSVDFRVFDDGFLFNKKQLFVLFPTVKDSFVLYCCQRRS